VNRSPDIKHELGTVEKDAKDIQDIAPQQDIRLVFTKNGAHSNRRKIVYVNFHKKKREFDHVTGEALK